MKWLSLKDMLITSLNLSFSALGLKHLMFVSNSLSCFSIAFRFAWMTSSDTERVSHKMERKTQRNMVVNNNNKRDHNRLIIGSDAHWLQRVQGSLLGNEIPWLYHAKLKKFHDSTMTKLSASMTLPWQN